MTLLKKSLTSPLLSEEHPGFTAFPQMRTSPLTLPLDLPHLHDTHTAIMCAATYHLAVPMKRVLQQLAVHPIAEWNLPH